MSSPTIYAFTDNDDGRDISINISPTLRCGGKNGGGTRLAIAYNKGVSGTLAASGAGSERPAGNCNETDMLVIAPTITAYNTDSRSPQSEEQQRIVSAVHQSVGQVRRLTVTECERLQAFPDGYTDVPYRGKPAADGPRYRAIGNSMCVAVMRQLGEAIQNYENSLNENAA